MTDLSTDFKFWCPIAKAQEVIDPTTGEQKMRLGGIASTADKDADGEYLDPKGFDIKPLMTSGLVNWHHQAKGQPSAIIGEPSKAEIRPDGLYIETDLYPSSKIAHDVWDLANTLEKDSKTRRLGYSIEGKVLKRKSDDPNSPDYKKITKAVITGVAITHMPKNPKTFANIIKGEIEDDFDEEEEKEDTEEENKSLDTEDAAALKKESVDKKMKNQIFGKSQVMERLFKDVPGINISKAKEIFKLITKIADMKGKKTISEEDIAKAYEALGLDFNPSDEDVEKGKSGCSEDDEEILKKGSGKSSEDDDNSEDDEEEEDEEEVEDDDEEEDEEDEDEEDDDEDEEEKGCGSKMKKGGLNPFQRIEKALAVSHQKNSEYFRALGVMVKDASIKLEKAAARENELLDIIKAQDETISSMSDRLEQFGSETPGPKSISSARPIERHFNKAEDDTPGIEKGGMKKNVISMSKNPNAVAELLDQATFNKGGYDEEFSKACVSFEATHQLPSAIISRIKNEYGFEIVK